MQSPPSRQTVLPYLIIPESLARYSFDYNQDKIDRIILTFMVIRSFPKIREQKELFSIIAKYTGSRHKDYIECVMKTGINPLDDAEFESCTPYYFTSPSVADAVNELLEHL
jgi:hypothetical protein